MKLQFSIAALLIAFFTRFSQAELFVDGGAAPGGDGTANRPFVSIRDAMKVAIGGDTITVRKGTYSEAIDIGISGTPEQPTVLRTTPGERVIISGFAPISNWKAEAGGVYTAQVEGRVGELYVGYGVQPIAGWPAFDQPMRHVKNPDNKANTFQDVQSLKGQPGLKDIIASPKSAAALFSYSLTGANSVFPIAGVDPDTNTVAVAPAPGFASVKGTSYLYQLINHPSLIHKPGEWAVEKLGETECTVFFMPAKPEDLKQTQFRKALHLISALRGVKNLHIEGFEICGSAGDGVQIDHASNVIVSNCIFHSNAGAGVGARRCHNVTFKNNVSVANGEGMQLMATHTGNIEGNEVAYNLGNGIAVAGNVTGVADGQPDSVDITVKNNYIHHQILRASASNFLCRSGVDNLKLQDNVILFGMQGVITADVKGGAISNCVILGCGATVFSSSNSESISIANSTLGLGGPSGYNFAGKDCRLEDNVFWNDTLPLPPTVTSDYNLFYLNQTNLLLAKVPSNKDLKSVGKDLKTIEEVAAATGQETHSKQLDAKFRNAPVYEVAADLNEADRVNHIILRSRDSVADMTQFAKGDVLEINGDGVLRHIMATGKDSIDFEPALSSRLFRNFVVWNWKQHSSALDLHFQDGSPALTCGQGAKPVGAVLDIAAYQRGEFYGDSKRSIPELPADVKALISDPNCTSLPSIP